MKINKLSFSVFAILASVVVLFASCTFECKKEERKPQKLVEVSNPEGVIV